MKSVSQRQAEQQSAERATEARRLLSKLAVAIAALERGGTWGASGSLGRIIENLKDLTGENS